MQHLKNAAKSFQNLKKKIHGTRYVLTGPSYYAAGLFYFTVPGAILGAVLLWAMDYEQKHRHERDPMNSPYYVPPEVVREHVRVAIERANDPNFRP
jgi:hypothetical protein